mgnify:CR=1 FL=1
MSEKFISIEQYRLFQTRAINGKIPKERFDAMVAATDMDSLPESVEPELTLVRAIKIANNKLPKPD